MEGLNIIEKSHTSLCKFKESILSSSFRSATQLVINLTNYDMKTRAGIRKAVTDILEVYKDDLGIDSVSKLVCKDTITIKLDYKVDGFVDDLIDSLKDYITIRASQLFTILTNSANSGGGLLNGI